MGTTANDCQGHCTPCTPPHTQTLVIAFQSAPGTFDVLCIALASTISHQHTHLGYIYYSFEPTRVKWRGVKSSQDHQQLVGILGMWNCRSAVCLRWDYGLSMACSMARSIVHKVKQFTYSTAHFTEVCIYMPYRGPPLYIDVFFGDVQHILGVP